MADDDPTSASAERTPASLLVAPVWRRRWLGLVGLGLLAGLIGGVVIATAAGMRRSVTAFDRLVERSGASDIAVRSVDPKGLPPAIRSQLASLPGVRSDERIAFFVGRSTTGRDWWSVRSVPRFTGAAAFRPVLRDGRLPRADAADEVIVSVNTARVFGLDVGSTVRVGLYTVGQADRFPVDTWTTPGGEEPELRVVGVYRDPLDVARSGAGTSVLAGPAFAARYGSRSGLEEHLLRTRPGTTAADVNRSLAAVERRPGRAAADRSAPAALAIDWLAPGRSGQEQSARVILAGLVAFGGVAAAAGLVVHGQSLRRWVHPLERDLGTWAMLGMTTPERRRVVAGALAPHAVVATVAAPLVAVGLSWLFPIGILRDIEPDHGVHLDVVALALGSIATLGVTFLLGGLVAVTTVRRRRPGSPPARAATGPLAPEVVGVGLPAALGMRFILRPVGRRRPLPVRTALLATVLAVSGVVAAGVFTSSLEQLVERPERYGAAWDLSLEMTSPLQGERATQRLVDDPRIAAVAQPVTFDRAIDVGGRPVKLNALQMRKGSSQVRPLSGRLPSGPDEIALGPRLLAELGLHLGDEVEVRSEVGPDGPLTVVGTTLSPAYESTTFNAEAVVDVDALDRAMAIEDLQGFVLTLVAFAPGVDHAAMIDEIDDRYDYALMKESFPSPPPEVRNLDQVRGIPMALSSFLCLLGLAALVHALVVATRARRHDLGVLRALGLERRQTRRVVLWMAATIGVVGAVVGPPLGVLVGAVGWRLVAGRLYIDPALVVPVDVVAASVAAAVVLGVVVAIAPSRRAGSIPTMEAVRSE